MRVDGAGPSAGGLEVAVLALLAIGVPGVESGEAEVSVGAVCRELVRVMLQNKRVDGWPWCNIRGRVWTSSMVSLCEVGDEQSSSVLAILSKKGLWDDEGGDEPPR